MSFIKNKILKIIKGYGDSADYCEYLRKKGEVLGENVHFYSPHRIHIDITRPYGVKIGNNVHIAADVSILTHGFDWIVLKTLNDDVLGSFGEVVIGDNVFIGQRATILKGVHIGNNVIVGAGALVTKDLESDGVYCGNPARRVCSISEYYEKRKAQQLNEAKALVLSYVNRYGKMPPKKELSEFFFLFEDRNEELLPEFVFQMKNNGKLEECKDLYLSGHRKQFENYEEFLNYCVK